jgi:abortive infection bacteriophage resistance protein
LIYKSKNLDCNLYLEELEKNGLNFYKSKEEYINELKDIGVFHFRGYVKAFKKKLNNYYLEDILNIYYLDEILRVNLLKMVLKIEIVLKASLIRHYYNNTQNPFLYLSKTSYKDGFKGFNDTFREWQNCKKYNYKESYQHFVEYYLGKYSFENNREFYLKNIEIIEENNINFPPFCYLVENLTFGNLINITSTLNINNQDILKNIAKEFGFYQSNIFLSYLLRAKEVRNRVAHNARIYNRNYRSVKAITKTHKELRKEIYEHRLLDVYYSLLLLLNRKNNIKNLEDLINKFISTLLDKCDDKSINIALRYMKKGKRACRGLP